MSPLINSFVRIVLWRTIQGATPSNEHYISVNGNNGGNYNNDGAKKDGAIAIGKDTTAKAENSTAIGYKAISVGENSIAIGKEASTKRPSGIAIGDGAKSKGTGSIAIGKNVSSELYSFTAGYETVTEGTNSGVVIGNKAKAIVGGGGLTDTSYQISIGTENIAEGGRSTAIGLRSHAYNSSVAIGEKNVAGGPAVEDKDNPLNYFATDNAVAIGVENKATNVYTTAIGSENVSKGYGGTTLGRKNITNGNYSIAIGKENVSEKYGGITLGTENRANGNYSIAIGNENVSSGESSLALGHEAVSSAKNSIAIGNNANAKTNNGIAIGANTRTDGIGTISIGEGAFGNNSIAIGKNSYAAGSKDNGSIAIGENAKANSVNSIVIGKGAQSDGIYSSGNVILGANSIIKENSYDATIIGTGAKVESNRSVAIGASSVAKDRDNRLGYDTITNGSVDISSKLTDTQNEQYEIAKNEYKIAVDRGEEMNSRKEELIKIPYDQRTPEQKAELLKLNQDIGENNNIVAEKYGKVSEFESTWKATSGEVAVGDVEKNITRQITGVAAGTQDTDAVNVAQLKSLDKKTFDRLEGEQVYFGKDAEATGENSIAIGSGSSALAKNSISLGANSETKVSYENTVAKYSNIQNKDSASGVVSIGRTGNERRITNVAGGVEANDAVNVAQLDAVTNATGLTEKEIIDINNGKAPSLNEKIENNKEKLEEHDKYIQNSVINTEEIRQSVSSNKQAINGLSNRVDKLESKLNRGMSLMSAMSSVDFTDVNSGELGIGAGVGHYENSQSVAVGVAYAPTDNLKFSAKWAATAGYPRSNTIGAGVTYKFKIR